MPKRPQSEYLERIGWAMYAFQGLEWSLIHVLKDAGQPIAQTSTKTSGPIASLLVALWEGDEVKSELASRFTALVTDRNHLAHSHPATMGGEDRVQSMHRWKVHGGNHVFWITDNWLDEFSERVRVLHRDLHVATRG